MLAGCTVVFAFFEDGILLQRGLGGGGGEGTNCTGTLHPCFYEFGCPMHSPSFSTMQHVLLLPFSLS